MLFHGRPVLKKKKISSAPKEGINSTSVGIGGGKKWKGNLEKSIETPSERFPGMKD